MRTPTKTRGGNARTCFVRRIDNPDVTMVRIRARMSAWQ
jgi:hypothetical protein